MDLKNYPNLRTLSQNAAKKFRIPTLVCLGLFVLGFATLVVDFIPFGLTMTMILAILPAAVFGIFWWVSHLLTKRNLKKFTPVQLDQIDRDIPGKPSCDGILVTRQAVIGVKAGLELIPMDSLLWMYNSVTTTRYMGFIPVHKATTIVFAGRDHKRREIGVRNKGNALEFLQQEVLHYRQDVVFGYERGVEDIYEKDIGRLIAFSGECAEKRQKGTL